MSKIDFYKVKNYIHNNEDKYISMSSLKQMLIVYCIFSTFSLVCIFFNKALLWNIVLFLLTVIYIITIFCFKRKSEYINTFVLRFKVNYLFALFSSIYFLILAYCFLSITDSQPIIYIIILTVYILLGIFYNCLVLWLVKTGNFLNIKTQKYEKAKRYFFFSPIIGVLIGVGCVRIFRILLSLTIMINIGIFFSCMISYLCLLGTTNFIKYYYSKKFLINTDRFGNGSSIMLIEKNTILNNKKRVYIIFQVIILILFVLLIIIGIVIQY